MSLSIDSPLLALVVLSSCNLKFRSPIHCPSVVGTLSVVVSSFKSSNFFSPEAVRDTLVSYAWHNVVLPDTRVVTPQLHEELHTLPVEVSFYSRADTCIKHVVLKIILPQDITENSFSVYAGILRSSSRVCIQHLVCLQ